MFFFFCLNFVKMACPHGPCLSASHVYCPSLGPHQSKRIFYVCAFADLTTFTTARIERRSLSKGSYMWPSFLLLPKPLSKIWYTLLFCLFWYVDPLSYAWKFCCFVHTISSKIAAKDEMNAILYQGFTLMWSMAQLISSPILAGIWPTPFFLGKK